MEEDKNLEQNLDNSNEKLHISSVINWVAIEDKLPDDYDVVLVCYENGNVNTDEYLNDHFKYGFYSGLMVRYWAKLPKPPYL
jgi:hypothetical protein